MPPAGAHTVNAGAASHTPTPGKSKFRPNISSPSCVAEPHAIALVHAGTAPTIARGSVPANGPTLPRAATETQFCKESIVANASMESRTLASGTIFFTASANARVRSASSGGRSRTSLRCHAVTRARTAVRPSEPISPASVRSGIVL